MNALLEEFAKLFSSDGFIPRRVCGLWPEWMVWEHIVGNALVWLAYVAVPLMIWRLGRRGQAWRPFRGFARSFSLFIGLCGLGHFLDMLAFFHPMYRFSGHVLVITGLVSCWTAWSLRGAWPALMSLKSPVELERVIADLQRSEAALKESQRLAGVGSWEWEPVSDLAIWSDELYRIFGLDPGLPAPSVAEQAAHFTPESMAQLNAILAATLETGEPYEIELEMVRGDERRWMLARGEAIRGLDGRITMLRGAAQDVTARKRFEEELRHARDEAMAATRSRSEFLANMSHEIRTPMNGVVGMTELLLDSQLNNLQRGYAQTIAGSGEALLTVINDILDFSKIEAGKLTLESACFDLRAIIDEVANLLAPRVQQKNLTILRRFSTELPDRLIGDPIRIRQVLTNLAGNAVKFTYRGEVALEAGVVGRGEGHVTIRVVVRDTGIGIPVENQAEVFQSFTQIDGGNSRRYGGTGLGLTICRNLVDLMGGRIGLESRPGEGSAFWFEVSLGEVPAEAESPAPCLDGFGSLALEDKELPSSLRILLAEDNEVNRQVAVGLAERAGCWIEAVGNGREAVESLDYDRHDLILMDVQMPEMDGLKATAIIRDRERGTGRHIPIIAMTARAMQGDRDRCLAAGMDDYLSKPIRPGPFREALLAWSIASNAPPERPEQPASRSFDAGLLTEALGDDVELIRQVLDSMLQDVPGRLDRLDLVVRSRNGRQVSWEAHGLKGTFLTIGAEGLVNSCQDLTTLGDQGDFAAIEPIHRPIRGDWNLLADEVRRYLDQLDFVER